MVTSPVHFSKRMHADRNNPGVQINAETISESGHVTAAVLLPGFAIN